MQYPLTHGDGPFDWISSILLPLTAANRRRVAWLRDNDPIHWHEEPNGPGFWAVTGYDDVKLVGRDAATFSSCTAS